MTAEDAKALAIEVRDRILFHPEQHDQNNWIKGVLGDEFPEWDCDTTACVAGWACLLRAYQVEWTNVELLGWFPSSSFAYEARRLLGLSRDESRWLFSVSRTRVEVLDALDRIGKGLSPLPAAAGPSGVAPPGLPAVT